MSPWQRYDAWPLKCPHRQRREENFIQSRHISRTSELKLLYGCQICSFCAVSFVRLRGICWWHFAPVVVCCSVGVYLMVIDTLSYDWLFPAGCAGDRLETSSDSELSLSSAHTPSVATSATRSASVAAAAAATTTAASDAHQRQLQPSQSRQNLPHGHTLHGGVSTADLNKKRTGWVGNRSTHVRLCACVCVCV